MLLFTFGISLVFAESSGLYGKYVTKKREKGEIIENIKWTPFPKILDVNMGIPSQLKFEGISNSSGTVTFLFEEKAGKKMYKKVKVDKGSLVDKSFKFENFYYSKLAGKNGTLTIISQDKTGKEVFKKIVEVRGEME
ncbi:MAG: hypothetical protein NXH75_01980 [Halobacteriovoraceae bacterium]|nr:hypothetical protein [Halobacteriovoraceae bacterium]